MLIVNKKADTLSDSEILALQNLSTTALADGMSEAGIRTAQVLPAPIKAVTKRTDLLGVAYTVKAYNGNSFPVHAAIYDGKPGYVLVIDTNNYEEGPYLGDLMAVTAEYMELSGIVLNGLVRDAVAIKDMNFPIFCKGFLPTKPSKENTGEINSTINMEGVQIYPGDVIRGDADGVIVIPRNSLARVISLAVAKEQKDLKRKADIEAFFKDNQGNRKKLDITSIMLQSVAKMLTNNK
jgi:RraA family protein